MIEHDLDLEVRLTLAAYRGVALGGVADLGDRALERRVGQRVHGDLRLLALPQIDHVGLVDVGAHQHARQVGDHQHLGARVVHGAGHDDLTLLDVERADHTVERCDESGLAEVVVGRDHQRLGAGDVLLG